MKTKIKILCFALSITIMSCSSEIHYINLQDSVNYDVLYLLSMDILNDSVKNNRWSHVEDSDLEYYETVKTAYLENKTYYDSLFQSVSFLYHTMYGGRSSSEIEKDIEREREYIKKRKNENETQFKKFQKIERLYKSKKTYYDSLLNAWLDSVPITYFPLPFDTIIVDTRIELKSIYTIEYLINNYRGYYLEDYLLHNQEDRLHYLEQELAESKKKDKQRALYSGLKEKIDVILRYKYIDRVIKNLESDIHCAEEHEFPYDIIAPDLKEMQLQLTKFKKEKTEFENNILLQQIKESFNKQHAKTSECIRKLDSVEYENLVNQENEYVAEMNKYIDSLLINCDWMRNYAEYFYSENESQKKEGYFNFYNEEDDCVYTAFYDCGNDGSLCYSCKNGIPDIVGCGSTFRYEVVFSQENDTVYYDERLLSEDYGNGVSLASGTWQGWTLMSMEGWEGGTALRDYGYVYEGTDSLLKILNPEIFYTAEEYFLGDEVNMNIVSEEKFNESLQHAKDSLFAIYGQPCPVECVPINICQVIKRYKSLILGINEDTTIRNTDRKANTRIVYPAKYETFEPFSFSEFVGQRTGQEEYLLLYLISQDLISEVMKSKSK